jgi:hypothetical protein
MIRAEAEKDPSILQPDPVWMKKLETPEGIEEYLNTRFPNWKEIDFESESCKDLKVDLKKFPELCVKLLNASDEYFFSDIHDFYWHGLLDEDTMRLDPMINMAKNWLNNKTAGVEESENYMNIHWYEKYLQDTENFCNTILTDKYREYSLSYSKTEDNLRIDLGLIISRPSIFLA